MWWNWIKSFLFDYKTNDSMSKKKLVELSQKALKEYEKIPHDIQKRRMIEKGTIDENGQPLFTDEKEALFQKKKLGSITSNLTITEAIQKLTHKYKMDTNISHISNVNNFIIIYIKDGMENYPYWFEGYKVFVFKEEYI